MATQLEDITDFVSSTLKWFDERGAFADLASKYQSYPAFSKFRSKKRKKFQSGQQIQISAVTDENYNAAWVGLHDVNNVNYSDVIVTGQVPWRHVKTSWGWALQEFLANRGKSQVLDLIKTREWGGRLSFANLWEDTWWNSAAAAAANPLMMFPIDYWLYTDPTTPGEGVFGFVDENNASFTGGAGGISCATYPRWGHGYGEYTNVSRTDFVRVLREAFTKCQWRPPIEHPNYGTDYQYGFYTNYNVYKFAVEIAEDRNDRLGFDLLGPQPLWSSIPIEYVRPLDDGPLSSTNPFFGIDWEVMHIVMLSGMDEHKTGPQAAPGQRLDVECYIDTTCNTVCFDRKRCFKIANAYT